MKNSMLVQYKIKKLNPSRIVEAMCAVVGSKKTHEIFTEHINQEVWEQVASNRKENESLYEVKESK